MSVPLNLGAGGKTVNAETIAGEEIQRIKLVLGAAGVDGGDIAATNPVPVRVGDGAGNTQPAGDAFARAIFVRCTDGTNSQPTMDAVGRAGFVKITDGTNTMPTMDALARPGFVKVTDGTNVQPTGDAIARSLFVRSGDGTNSTPAGDASARAIFTAAGGDVAHGSADSGNPLKLGAKAGSAFQTAVANNQRTDARADTFGRLLIAQIDPAQQVKGDVAPSTAQTGANVIVPSAGKRLAITHIQIGTKGSTPARMILWFAATGTTAFVQGTHMKLFDASFVPSATTGYPGALISFPSPIFCPTADACLKITTDAALDCQVLVFGYEF